MTFDIEGARKAGYSDAEIADFLSSQNKFDASGARQAGYSDPEIIAHLTPQPSFTDELGRQLGLTARAAVKSVAAVPNMVADPLVSLYNRFTGSQVPSFSDRQDQALTNAGLPQPKNGLERVVQSGATALGPVGMGATVAKGVKSLAPLAENLNWQALSSMLGAGASEAAKEGGAGPGGQVVAGLVGGVSRTNGE